MPFFVSLCILVVEDKMRKNKIRVLSGVRASHSSLHLGNLLGAIQGMVELQEMPEYETYYMVADLHGITTKFDPKELNRNRIEVVKDYLATGIDPKRSVLFLQSDVSEHTELAYLLSSLSPVKRIMRLPSKKDEYKSYADKDQLVGVSFALLGYPVLMAADILLYKAEKVPIGLDQEPHLEFTREVTKRLNKTYGLNFPLPTRFSVFAEKYTVPSILGEGKMSKSKPGSAIFLNDSYEVVKKKIFGMPTDIGKGMTLPSESDDVYAFFLMIELILGEPRRKEAERQYLDEGIKYSEYKQELTDAIFDILEPIQKKRRFYDNNPEEIDKILKSGAERARRVARATLSEIKIAMGLE